MHEGSVNNASRGAVQGTLLSHPSCDMSTTMEKPQTAARFVRNEGQKAGMKQT